MTPFGRRRFLKTSVVSVVVIGGRVVVARLSA